MPVARFIDADPSQQSKVETSKTSTTQVFDVSTFDLLTL
ncbi:hypothetical protein FTUN_3063 [Frigoriglobus tundricola]|uniref:Uncharacterized protein n=1 Tax=Frigoriglobus tundricola TaxID=2774151 RepID=A0A6M5YPT7_9BACT|nr:hypothetical protein FTUN_3063 [Frigoriglobus tundricola]